MRARDWGAAVGRVRDRGARCRIRKGDGDRVFVGAGGRVDGWGSSLGRAQEAVYINFGGRTDVHLAVGNTWHSELNRIASSVAVVRSLRAVPEFSRNICGVMRV